MTVVASHVEGVLRSITESPSPQSRGSTPSGELSVPSTCSISSSTNQSDSGGCDQSERSPVSVAEAIAPVRVVGAGSDSKVVLARDRSSGAHFVLKVVTKTQCVDADRLRRLLAERDILSAVHHPFIVTFYGALENERYLFIAMEYCPGGDFYSLVQQQPHHQLPEHAVRLYAAEVVHALDYLHHNDIVLRDLKLENLLVDADGHLKLADFDLSKRMEAPPPSSPVATKASAPRRPPQRFFLSDMLGFFQTTQTQRKPPPPPSPRFVRKRLTSFVGTEEYLAPEVLQGKGYDECVDWWALGILMFEMLYGGTPFVADTQEKTFANILKNEVQFPSTPQVSSSCHDLIRHLLDHNPAERIGHGLATGGEQIKQHAFFAGIDWSALRAETPLIVPPPVSLKTNQELEEQMAARLSLGPSDEDEERVVDLHDAFFGEGGLVPEYQMRALLERIGVTGCEPELGL